jgi:hypothetical protein
MTRRSVARTYPEIILQAQNILTALRAYEVELGIHYNTAVRLEVELSAALGDPASASEGAQAELNERRGALSAARESRDATLAAARAFCANAIDTVKPRLGRRWNAKWLAVGFTRRSLSIPREPAALLCDLRAYFLSHPGHESADLGLTAVGADELAATLNARNATKRGAFGTKRSSRCAGGCRRCTRSFVKSCRATIIAGGFSAVAAQSTKACRTRWRGSACARDRHRTKCW